MLRMEYTEHSRQKDHSHYGEKVQAALKNFRETGKIYESYKKVAKPSDSDPISLSFVRQNYDRLLQEAFDELCRARLEDVGLSYYLTKEAYDLIKPFHDRSDTI